MTAHPGHLVFSREAIRKVDAQAIQHYHMPGIILMENAARGLTLHALQMIGWPENMPSRRILVIAGQGNNGGDGFASARLLHNLGIDVQLLILRSLDSYSGDACTNLDICLAMNLPHIVAPDDPVAAFQSLSPNFDLIVDAILGTGLTSPVRPPVDSLINHLNTRQWSPILAVDVPSGLDCDTGQPLGCAIQATATVTFVGLKKGFLQPHAQRYLGRVIVTDIGIPRQLAIDLAQPLNQ